MTAADRSDREPRDRAHEQAAAIADCADVVLRLFEYVDNEAQSADQELIRAHLDGCRSCLREYERDVLLKALVRRACGCEPAPETLRTQILARITSGIDSGGRTTEIVDVTQVTTSLRRDQS